MMNINVEQAVKTMRREFVDLTNQEFSLGVARAINHTLSKTKTASNREIRQVYNLPARYVSQALSIRRASRMELYGLVIAQGKPVPIDLFKARQTREGVSVEIKKGKRQVVKSAFITTLKSGKVTAMARGTYQGNGGFNFRHRRVRPAGGYALKGERFQPVNNDLEITQLTSVSVPRAFANQVILTNLKRGIEDEFPKRMMHELMRIRG